MALYCDNDFFGPTALYTDPSNPPKDSPEVVRWLRPSEMTGVKAPVLFKDGFEPGDICQGALGDCWFLGALSVLATKQQLFRRIFKDVSQGPSGKYTLTFFKNGKWREVVIDDRIPCDEAGYPLYSHGADPNETWVMLVEKAYAKLHGGYEELNGGQTDYALRDLTAGVPSRIDLTSPESKALNESGALWTKIVNSLTSGSLLGCAASGTGGIEEETQFGILLNHAYGILRTAVVDGVQLLCIRNPWGQKEWTGAWSDKSSDWTPARRAQLGHTAQDDGTFWMSFEDFLTQYNSVNVCYLFPDDWSGVTTQGEWKGVTAGGNPGNASWCLNPQYTFVVKEPTELTILLSQPDARLERKGKVWNQYDACIGFAVVSDPENVGTVKKLLKKAVVAKTGPYRPVREVEWSGYLPKGIYIVIPSTFDPKEESSFVLSIFSEKAIELEDARAVPENQMPEIDNADDAYASDEDDDYKSKAESTEKDEKDDRNKRRVGGGSTAGGVNAGPVAVAVAVAAATAASSSSSSSSSGGGSSGSGSAVSSSSAVSSPSAPVASESSTKPASSAVTSVPGGGSGQTSEQILALLDQLGQRLNSLDERLKVVEEKKRKRREAAGKQ